MKWFKNWVEKKHRQHVEQEHESYKMATNMAIPKAILSSGSGPSISQNGIRFTVYKATGGVVIETQMYEDRTDRNRNTLYVVTSDKDIGSEIGKIITLEALKS